MMGAVCLVVLQCVAVCYSVLQCVLLCCSVLQCVAVCYSVLQCLAVLQCVAVCYSVLQCVAVCLAVLQCVAVCFTNTHGERGSKVHKSRITPFREIYLTSTGDNVCRTVTLFIGGGTQKKRTQEWKAGEKKKSIDKSASQ